MLPMHVTFSINIREFAQMESNLKIRHKGDNIEGVTQLPSSPHEFLTDTRFKLGTSQIYYSVFIYKIANTGWIYIKRRDLSFLK